MVSQGMRDSFWLWGMQVGLKGAYDCVKAFSEIDMTEDLGRIEVPALIIHGDDDHSRRRRPDRAHQGLCPPVRATRTERHAQGVSRRATRSGPDLPAQGRVNADLLEFIKA
jgi:pimeloyl-ACP methyl ester carboxylesterase